MTKLFCGQYFAEGLSIGIFLTAKFDLYWNKYPHSRAYRVALLDAGHLSQTFQLVASALDVNPWLTGVFQEDRVEGLLNIISSSEQPIFFIGAGLGKKTSLDKLAISKQEGS